MCRGRDIGVANGEDGARPTEWNLGSHLCTEPCASGLEVGCSSTEGVMCSQKMLSQATQGHGKGSEFCITSLGLWGCTELNLCLTDALPLVQMCGGGCKCSAPPTEATYLVLPERSYTPLERLCGVFRVLSLRQLICVTGPWVCATGLIWGLRHRRYRVDGAPQESPPLGLMAAGWGSYTEYTQG